MSERFLPLRERHEKDDPLAGSDPLGFLPPISKTAELENYSRTATSTCYQILTVGTCGVKLGIHLALKKDN